MRKLKGRDGSRMDKLDENQKRKGGPLAFILHSSAPCSSLLRSSLLFHAATRRMDPVRTVVCDRVSLLLAVFRAFGQPNSRVGLLVLMSYKKKMLQHEVIPFSICYIILSCRTVPSIDLPPTSLSSQYY